MTLTLAEVGRWHRVCAALADSSDRVVGAYLGAVVGRAPW
jgi:hypothetical protein